MYGAVAGPSATPRAGGTIVTLSRATRSTGVLLSAPAVVRWRSTLEDVLAGQELAERRVLAVEEAVAPWQMKNWLPAESGLEERAIESTRAHGALR